MGQRSIDTREEVKKMVTYCTSSCLVFLYWDLSGKLRVKFDRGKKFYKWNKKLYVFILHHFYLFFLGQNSWVWLDGGWHWDNWYELLFSMVGNWLGCCGFMLASVCSATFARKCGFIYPIMRSFRVFVYGSF